MTGEVRVVEDGAPAKATQPRVIPSWVWLIAGIAVGLGFGIVLFTPVGSGVDAPPTTGLPGVGDVTAQSASIGVGERIEGFPDALVGVAADDANSLIHVLWPVAGDPVVRSLSGGDFGDADFDSSGTWLAFTTAIPDSNGLLLSMGKPASVAPMVSSVTSFAWHDSEPGLLSYTQVVDDEWHLVTVGPNRRPEMVTSGFWGGDVVAWGDWGWALSGGADAVVWLLDPSGALKATPSGDVLDSAPSGWLLLADGGLKLVSAGGGVDGLDVPLDFAESVYAGAMSPDGAMVAVLGHQGLKVFSRDRGEEIADFPTGFGAARLVWSSDSRFVAVTGSRGAVVVDTVDSSEPVFILGEHRFRAISVISLAGP